MKEGFLGPIETKGAAMKRRAKTLPSLQEGKAGEIKVDLSLTGILNHHVLGGTWRKLKPRVRMFLLRWRSQTDDEILEIF